MPKFARPNSYTGKQSNQSWTGSVRAANSVETAAGVDDSLYISPVTLAEALEAIVTTISASSAKTSSKTAQAIKNEVSGSVNLVKGTATVSMPNISTNDLIILSRISANGSIGLGTLTYTISSGKSFTINSLALGAPTMPQPADISKVGYQIVKSS